MTVSTPSVDAPLGAPAVPAPFRPVLVAAERCKGCGLCVDVCPPHVLALDERSVNPMGHHPVELVDPAGCTSCAKCARMCPDAGLTVVAPARER